MVPLLTPLASASSLILRRPFELKFPVPSSQFPGSCYEAALRARGCSRDCARLFQRLDLSFVVAQALEHLVGVLTEGGAGLVDLAGRAAQLHRHAELLHRLG